MKMLKRLVHRRAMVEIPAVQQELSAVGGLALKRPEFSGIRLSGTVVDQQERNRRIKRSECLYRSASKIRRSEVDDNSGEGCVLASHHAFP
jgi:hypothetical protein